jgi:hypothetical protein
MESAKVGKRGAILVPAKLRKRFGIEEGSRPFAAHGHSPGYGDQTNKSTLQ